MIKGGWLPPRSPYSLIQEDLFPSEWLILVSCLLLNCTSRKQVEKLFNIFVDNWSTPETFLHADEHLVKSRIRSLGFVNRRYHALKSLALAFLDWNGHDARDLPYVGEYAGRAWDIFCRGELGSSPPKDGALVKYWHWAVNLKDNNGQKIW